MMTTTHVVGSAGDGLRHGGWLGVSLALLLFACVRPTRPAAVPAAAPCVPSPSASPANAKGTSRGHESLGPLEECSPDGWCWENPLPHGHDLRSIWGSAADDVWVVGAGGVVLHWNGNAWLRERQLPDAPRASSARQLDLTAVWGRARNDVWAVGWYGAAIHWDGKTWTAHHVPNADRLDVVGGGDKGTLWTSSVYGDRNVWTWDGVQWVRRTRFRCDANGCSGPYVHRSSAGGGYRPVPDGYWDGDLILKSLPSFAGRSFGGTRESAIWFIDEPGGGSLQKWNGAKWETLDAHRTFDWRGKASLKTRVRAIWGARDDDVWAVGNGGTIVRFNGADVMRVDSPTNDDLTSVWGSGPGDVWAAGDGVLLHWDGIRWNRTGSSVTTADLKDVGGTDPDHLWAVGLGGTIVRRQNSAWSLVASGVSTHLWGLSAADPESVWFVGERGTILHFDGTSVSRVSSPSSLDLYGVWARSGDDVWAVGAQGCLLHWDGARWSQAQGPTQATFRRVQGVSASIVFVVGDHGTVIRWDGAKWSDVSQGLTSHGEWNAATGVVVRDMDDVWVTLGGVGRPFRHWDGHQWSPVGSTSYWGPLGIAIAGPVLWGVGAGFVVEKEGDVMTESRATSGRRLHAVWASKEGDVWAVGDHGTIVSRRGRS